MSAQSSDPSDKKKPVNSYLKYSGLAFQLLAAIGVCGWLGYKLDQYLGLKLPAFMILFGFLAFGGMMYQVYKSINQPEFDKISGSINVYCFSNFRSRDFGSRNTASIFLSNINFSIKPSLSHSFQIRSEHSI